MSREEDAFRERRDALDKLINEYAPKVTKLVNEGMRKHIIGHDEVPVNVLIAAAWCFYLELAFGAMEPLLASYCRITLRDYLEKDEDKANAPLPAEMLEAVLGGDLKKKIDERFEDFRMDVSAEIEKAYADMILKD